MAEEAQEQETQQPAVQSTMSAAPKQLTSTDILSKMQTGTPLVQGEKLPDVPKGMSAKSFYGQFPGGAAVYSQAPFKQPTYGQVTTPITTTPTAPVSPPADTTPVDTAPIVEEEENLSGGPTAEDTALDEAIAESTTGTQMDDLFDFDIDSGYTFDYNPDITLTENIANEFNDFGLAVTADISSVTDGTVVLNDIDKTLTNIGNSLSTAYDNALEEGEDALLSFMDETKSILDDIESYAANPETIATDSFNYVTEALTEFYDNLSLMTQPDHPDFDLALDQLVTGATKALMGSALGAIIGVPVIGSLIIDLVTNSDFFSDAMLGHPGQYETVTYHPDTHTWSVEYTPTNIAYFDINGIARDINGKEVLTGRGGVATSGPTFVIPGHRISAAPTKFEKLPDVIRDVEGGGFHNVYDQYNPGTDFTPGTTAEEQRSALAEGDNTSGGGYVEDIDQRYGGATNIGPPEVGPTDTKIDPATLQDVSGIPTADPGVGYVDTFGDAPSLPEPLDTPTIAVSPEVEEDESTAPPAPPTNLEPIDKLGDDTVVDSDVTPSEIDMGGSVTSVQVQDNLENRTIDVDIVTNPEAVSKEIDNFAVENIANGSLGTVTLDTLYSMLASLYDPSLMPDKTKGISRNPEVVNKRGIDAVTKAIAEKERNITVKGSSGTDTLSNPYEAAETLFGEGETASTEQGEQDVAAQVDTFSDYGDDSDSDGSSGEAGDDSGKIICTMMNRMYGMGDYRIKQWLLYSDRHLTAEHQLGYHKLYCKLVSIMPSNKIVAKILSHMAEKRTDDIVAEMKHTKRSWLGRTYRTLLIDKPSYMVGWMIKRNWLQPADISILTRKTCNG
tara:strand:+ start:360 stop:2885 length:2526 start_codon:yes stop_codon:yes gene_type:complete